MVGQGSSPAGKALPPSHGRCDDALLPACESWIASLALPMRRQWATTRVSAASQASE